MGYRVGMTSNPEVKKLFSEAQYPILHDWQVLLKNLTYERAMDWKYPLCRLYQCKGYFGCSRMCGRVYSVYFFEFEGD